MKIALLGCGVVGSGVKEIIDNLNKDIIISKILVKNKNEITESRMTTDINEILNNDIDVVVECIGGVDIPFDFISRALRNKKHVVTSNKKVMATHYEKLINLAKENKVSLAFEACVGGGIPWFENIRHIKRIDKIFNFEGIFNGTTNYILDNMTSHKQDFDIVLKEAQNLGYAENDPTDDIDGHDVKYKCCLTANAIWNTAINLNDIIFYGIRNITKQDIDFALKNNKIPKLIGRGIISKDSKNKLDVFIIPSFIDNNENIAHIPKNINCGKINSEFLGESSYIGQGAGKFPTAHAVVQDIISIYENRNVSAKISDEFFIENKYSSNFYIRTKNIGIFSDIILEKINEDTIITKNISIKDLNNLSKNSNDTNIFIAEMRNDKSC